MTVLELLRSSLRMSGGLGVGQTPTADDGTDALVALNSMLSAWNLNSIRVPDWRRDLYTLVPNQAAYTLGPTGNWVATRPNKIIRAGFVQSQSLAEWPIHILDTQEDWADVTLKTLASSIPYAMFNDRGYPLSTLKFYPIPTGADQVALYTWDVLSSYSSTAATIVLPDGYTDAIRYNLAVRIAVEWGRQLTNPEEVKRLARESLAAIESMNSPDYTLQCDPGITGGSGHAWYGPFRGLFF